MNSDTSGNSVRIPEIPMEFKKMIRFIREIF